MELLKTFNIVGGFMKMVYVKVKSISWQTF